ncbi:ABC transporter permease [Brachybacterium sp. p3-SID1565]|uniref:ABC transporter permease n=1 Tax=Brachybacterium epidermidis TaxID=2781983 RepID=A0ABR9VXI9_9MICO|nr:MULTISPECIES: ABC transporter permease [Brachybacterium]MBE9402904.1 ABC transporter permease [Brachybacterium epidermidis]MCT1385895.1 ABC transporter permease [Brachybacterium sp. p3-SID1565]MCT1775025.1 ABC transporter permease [Brachybacterium sp. p3-SID957]
MSATTRLASDDAVVQKAVVDERPSTWWHLPLTTTILGVLGLIFFGLRGIPGASSTYGIAREKDLNPLGILPEQVTVPSMAASIVLAVIALLASAALWALQSRPHRLRPAIRNTLVGIFAVAWVLSFMTWVISERSLSVGTLLQSTVILAVPLAFGALSGVLSERAGVINIAIEGQLLFGAFGAALVGSLLGNVWAGLIAAPLVAVLMGALLALFAVGYQVQQIIVGVVLNVFAVGITSFFFGSVMSANPGMFNSPMRLPTLRIPLLADIPLIGSALFEQNILVYLMWVIVVVLTIALFRTRWGLRVRAVGEHPRAADTVGIKVNPTRWSNVLLGSAVAGLGGAMLTIGTGVAFGEDMSAGKGYIALAAMILGRYHPVGALLAALTFAFADSLQLRLGTMSAAEGGVSIPGDFLLMLPYVVALFAVAGVVGRVRVPAADGIPYVKQ